MKYELFSFQKKALASCESFLFDSPLKSGLCVIPTAGGKSVINAKLCTLLRGVPTLVVVPSEELLRQNYDAMVSEGLDVSIYSASMNSKVISNLTIATLGSLKDKGKEFKDFGIKFLFIDEAHFKFSSFSFVFGESGEVRDAIFKGFVKDLKPKKLLGFTATPFILSAVGGMACLKSLINVRGGFFKDIIHLTQIQEVVKEGRWSEIKYDLHPVKGSKLKVNTSGTDYSKESIELFLKENDVNNRVCLLLKASQDQKTLTFVESVDVANKIKEWYNSRGFKGRCEVVSGDTPKKERKAIIEHYKDVNSDLLHLINYGTLTTGFDFPQLGIVIGARPTMSLALYYQMLGRLTRVHEDKEFGLYIDLVGNCSKFGRIEDLNFDSVGRFVFSCFSGEKLLTDIPLTFPYPVTKSTIRNPPKRKFIANKNMKIWFGKYEGQLVTRLPKWYREYLLQGASDSPLNEKREALLELLSSLKYNEYTSIL